MGNSGATVTGVHQWHLLRMNRSHNCVALDWIRDRRSNFIVTPPENIPKNCTGPATDCCAFCATKNRTYTCTNIGQKAMVFTGRFLGFGGFLLLHSTLYERFNEFRVATFFLFKLRNTLVLILVCLCCSNKELTKLNLLAIAT